MKINYSSSDYIRNSLTGQAQQAAAAASPDVKN
jgi:hypothetical protein